MPRGTRALYAVDGTAHGSRADVRTHSATLHENLLPARCWCDYSYVLIHRSDLLDGNTGSCGSHCRPPDGGEAAPSVRLERWSGGGYVIDTPDGRHQIHRDRSGLHDALILWGRRGRDVAPPRSYPTDVRIRRDFVQSLYAQRKHPIDIALILDVPVVVVRDDLVHLRRLGKVA